MNKTFESQYGPDANYHRAILKDIDDDDDGNITANFYYLAYFFVVSYNSGKKPVDCFRPALSYSVTQADVAVETGNHFRRIKKAFIKKSTESIIVDSVETNVFNGNAGQICYVP